MLPNYNTELDNENRVNHFHFISDTFGIWKRDFTTYLVWKAFKQF